VVVGAQLAETLVSSGRQRPGASSTAKLASCGTVGRLVRLVSGGEHPVGYLREQAAGGLRIAGCSRVRSLPCSQTAFQMVFWGVCLRVGVVVGCLLRCG
jgi:hypothetical protein